MSGLKAFFQHVIVCCPRPAVPTKNMLAPNRCIHSVAAVDTTLAGTVSCLAKTGQAPSSNLCKCAVALGTSPEAYVAYELACRLL